MVHLAVEAAGVGVPVAGDLCPGPVVLVQKREVPEEERCLDPKMALK